MPRPTYDQSNGIWTQPDLLEVTLTAGYLHSWAIRSWLNKRFLLAEGVPVPVVYATPMDAFAEFNRLWQVPGGAYSYLQKEGGPQVWPENTRTPLISFNLVDARYRPELSAASRVNRYQAWLSTSNIAEGMRENYLGQVRQTRYAQAYDFEFNVDFWCQRPETQFTMMEQLMDGFRYASAGEAQTWVVVPYVVTHGRQPVRLKMASSIANLTESSAAPDGAITLYHTSVKLVIEGYRPDRTTLTVPTVWYMAFTVSPNNLSPEALAQAYILTNYDLRQNGQNPILDLRSNVPPAGGTYSGSYNGDFLSPSGSYFGTL